MPCPTCDHTLQKIDSVFWCPRCGTIAGTLVNPPEAPKLVARVQSLRTLFDPASNSPMPPELASATDYFNRSCRVLGITESVCLPSARVPRPDRSEA